MRSVASLSVVSAVTFYTRTALTVCLLLHALFLENHLGESLQFLAPDWPKLASWAAWHDACESSR